MTWVAPEKGFAQDDDFSAEAANEYAGDLEHLHEGLHIAALEQLTWVSGSIWQTANDYRSGKILYLFWNNVVIPAIWFTESAANQITFNTAMKNAVLGGSDTDSLDVVVATYIISE